MRSRRTIALSFAAAAIVAACATVADLDVEHDRGPDEDSDDSGVKEDVSGRVDPKPDGGAPSPDAKSEAAVEFAPCGCADTQGCCVPKTGKGACVAPGDGPTCTSGDGIFLRCTASDVDNGRSCCLANDNRTTFFAADCRDAGAQLCVKNEECNASNGETCQKTTCRDVVVYVCSPDAGDFPRCPK